ncbi:MAG: hypothetical protein EPN70_22660 [Paraburkholderia sp.]|uniref:hypothetical protein n=1 Tax=Paraburkholderia sp. TaxID=1926495 RepID=UPI0011F6A453|nr:hypothetical protein [Paraburkholderia sp.]TAM00364.1 MAG: hypothetical protein EPN70_22660 [Paraburkholderia sp.]
MRAIRFVMLILAVAVALTQFGCGRKSGEEFVGRWTKLSGNGSPEMTITRNGSGNDFYVASKVPNLNAESEKDALKTERVSGTYVDGKLMLMVGAPFALTIDKSSGHLVMDGAEYAKAK